MVGTRQAGGPETKIGTTPNPLTEPVDNPTVRTGGSLPPVEEGKDLTGTLLLDRYRILERIGAGGMGTVYLAEHCTIRKKVAIKVLAHEYTHRRELVDRFLQEARAASRISHPNVVEITDFGDTPDGSVFFVMEYLRGEDLGQTVREQGPLPWSRVQGLMIQICKALQAAHDAGVIHRDLKPDNCFRIRRGEEEDTIKVLDFGIAKMTGDATAIEGLTQTGMIFGTPEYMSPEQARGDKPTYLVDVYAAGVIMYQLLCGQVPFTAASFMGILTRHMFEAPRAPSEVAPEAEIPPEVEAVCLKALQKDPELRFESMTAMAAALRELGTGAAQVQVVEETLSEPSQIGQMEFSSSTIPGAEASAVAAVAPGRKNLTSVWGGALGLALVLGGGAYFAGASEKSEPDLAAAAAPVEGSGVVGAATPIPDAVSGKIPGSGPDAAPSPTNAPVPAQAPVSGSGVASGGLAKGAVAEPSAPGPAATKVSYEIRTNVVARVLDARDGAVYGETNGEPLEFERADGALRLILRARGYEDLVLETYPTRDKVYEEKLVRKSSKRRRSTRSRAAEAPAEPTTPSAPTSNPTPPELKSGDLKNPFQGR